MFRLFKIVTVIVGLIIIAGIIIYFLPATTKLKALNTITGVLPESLKGKTEDILLTPPQQRKKIITQLKSDLSDLRHSSSSQTIMNTITNSEALISKLEEKNNEQSLTEIIAHEVAQRLVNQITGTTTQCQN